MAMKAVHTFYHKYVTLEILISLLMQLQPLESCSSGVLFAIAIVLPGCFKILRMES